MALRRVLVRYKAATLAFPKNRSLRSRFFGSPAAPPIRHTLLNKFHPKINELNRQNAPSPLIRFAIGALFFCLTLSFIKFILFGCIFIFAVLFPISFPRPLFGSFLSFIVSFKEILAFTFIGQNHPISLSPTFSFWLWLSLHRKNRK